MNLRRTPPKVWVAASHPAAPRPLVRIDEWTRGRNWAVRLPLLVYFAFVFRNHLKDPFYTSLAGGLNLGIHELGHFLWAPFGELLAVLGGSLTDRKSTL